MQRWILLGMLLAVSCLSLSTDAVARAWKPKPVTMARDYSIIQHDLSGNEFVMLIWLSAPMMPPNQPGGRELRIILDDNIVVGFVHVRAGLDGKMQVISNEEPVGRTLSGTPLKQVNQAGLPAETRAALDAMKGVFAQSLGVFGQGLRWYVYSGDTISACTKGGFMVSYNGIDYDYQTPIPGC